MAKTWQVILATIAIFVAGLVTGGATAFGLVRWSRNHPRAQPMGPLAARPGQPQQFGPQLMRSFERQLDLTDDQRAQIEPIVRRTASQLGRERREVQLTTALAIEKMQDEISNVLTPDQRTKFDELVAKQRQRLQELRQQNQAYMLGARQAQPDAPK
jgi:Spy/CpxP family protein refolding chaperone